MRVLTLLASTVVALSFLLLGAGRVGAATPVSYRVDLKEFKKGAVAGELLTFEFYSDEDCTELYSSQAILSESIEVVSRLKLERVKGGPKPPKVAELHHTFASEAPPAFHLVVTGPGVAPIGSPCQAQKANPPAWEWLVVQSNAVVSFSSARLVGTTVSRPPSEPVGYFCVHLPPEIQHGHGIVATTQKSTTGNVSNDDIVIVTTVFNHTCAMEVPGTSFMVNTFTFNGADFVLADRYFNLMIPTGPSFSP